jgi:ribose transport system ATP-binding protein
MEGRPNSSDAQRVDTALSAQRLSVSFDGNKVLDAASLEVKRGSIHALLGQNGSGKSTLLKVLSGVYTPDPGAFLTIGGKQVSLPSSPDEIRRHGLAIVHQDLGLIPDMTVLENIRLRLFQTSWPWRISWRRERRLVEDAFERYGVSIPVSERVENLSTASRTVVAIVRALEEMGPTDQRNVLVLDEPTPHLTPDEVSWLFGLVKSIAGLGLGVILVTHRLEEVFEIGDEVTVLRDGKVALTSPVSALDPASLVGAVLGHTLSTFARPVESITTGDSAITLDYTRPSAKSFSVSAKKGEVLGITGLIGMGWEQIPYVLFGSSSHKTGTVTVEGKVVPLHQWTPKRAMDAGIALIPRDRSIQGSLPDFTLAENLTLVTLGQYFRNGLLHPRAERARSREVIDDFDVRPNNPSLQFRYLSGGNQQKAIVAKWWERTPRIILLDEPTQGIDIGARANIYQLIVQAAADGATVIITSVEYDELAKICDRVIVFLDGAPSVELAGDDVNAGAIAQACLHQNREN